MRESGSNALGQDWHHSRHAAECENSKLQNELGQILWQEGVSL